MVSIKIRWCSGVRNGKLVREREGGGRELNYYLLSTSHGQALEMLSSCHVTYVTHNTLGVVIQTQICLMLDCRCFPFFHIAFSGEVAVRVCTNPECFTKILSGLMNSVLLVYTQYPLFLIHTEQINKQREQ